MSICKTCGNTKCRDKQLPTECTVYCSDYIKPPTNADGIPATSEWEIDDNNSVPACSNCGGHVLRHWFLNEYQYTPYCPHCGEPMKKVQHDPTEEEVE